MNDLSKKASQAMIIEEDYVTLEQAKMLKDKGFDEDCFSYYYRTPEKEYRIAYDDLDGGDHWNSRGDGLISRPTHQMALKWFRVVHGLVINFYCPAFCEANMDWIWTIHHDDRTLGLREPFDTYEEATSAAIDYVLTNLI